MKMKVTLGNKEINKALGDVVLTSVGPGWRIENIGRIYNDVEVEITNDPPENRFVTRSELVGQEELDQCLP